MEFCSELVYILNVPGGYIKRKSGLESWNFKIMLPITCILSELPRTSIVLS